MSKRKFVFSTAIGLFLTVFASKSVFASEGQIELRNQQQGQAHCYAVSGYLPGEAQYNILVICRNLVYPVSPEALKYVVWMTPSNGSAPRRLGDLAFGKVTYKTNIPFSSMFVTQEKDVNINAPTGPTVMRGNVRSIPFLEAGSEPQLTDEPEATVSPSPSPAPRRTNVLSFLRSGAVLTVIAIFVVLLMLILVKPFK